MVEIPLPAALAVSVALHAAMLAVGGGRPAIPPGQAPDAAASASGPAPLTVRLFVEKIAPARIEAGLPPDIEAVGPQAPVIATPGAGTGDARTDMAPEEPARDAEPPSAGMPVPVYLDPGEVTRRAMILRDIAPDPPGLHGRRGPARIVLSLYINESGRVDRVEVESPEPDAAVRSAIVESFLAATFRPAEKDGSPVKSRMRIEVSVRPLMKY